MPRYFGSCHCGAIHFAIDTEITDLYTCDCSLCSRKNALMTSVHERDFKLVTNRPVSFRLYSSSTREDQPGAAPEMVAHRAVRNARFPFDGPHGGALGAFPGEDGIRGGDEPQGVGFAYQGIEDADALVDSLAAGAPLAAYEKRGEPAP